MGLSLLVLLASAGAASATTIQGVLADWDCVKPMVRDGHEKTLKNRGNCSLDKNYSRAAYGIITDDNHFYKLDDEGRGWALKLLKDSPDKNNLHVVIQGNLDGNTVHVQTMSEL
jgi:hypothetical protein